MKNKRARAGVRNYDDDDDDSGRLIKNSREPTTTTTTTNNIRRVSCLNDCLSQNRSCVCGCRRKDNYNYNTSKRTMMNIIIFGSSRVGLSSLVDSLSNVLLPPIPLLQT